MDESFYTPSIPRVKRSRGNSQGGYYQFRQPQTQINPLALRRLQLSNVISQRREEEAAGRQELEAMKEMSRLEMQEYKIRQEITKERQVTSAQREIANLDPLNDPHYQQSYAKIMSDHPLAQDNKFLNEAFTDGSRANYRAAQHRFTTLEEGQKQAGKEELAWIKAAGSYAAMGGDPAAFTDKDGNHDWNALNSAQAKAAQVVKSSAEAANTGLLIAKTVTKEGNTTITREAAKPPKSELTTAQKIGIAKLEGTHAGQIAQQEIFQKQMDDPAVKDKTEAKKNLDLVTANIALSKAQMDAVHGVTSPAPATPAPPVQGMGDLKQSESSGVAPPVATPTATPPAPPQEAIDYLKTNPHLAPHFDSMFGKDASTEFLTE